MSKAFPLSLNRAIEDIATMKRLGFKRGIEHDERAYYMTRLNDKRELRVYSELGGDIERNRIHRKISLEAFRSEENQDDFDLYVSKDYFNVSMREAIYLYMTAERGWSTGVLGQSELAMNMPVVLREFVIKGGRIE